MTTKSALSTTSWPRTSSIFRQPTTSHARHSTLITSRVPGRQRSKCSRIQCLQCPRTRRRLKSLNPTTRMNTTIHLSQAINKFRRMGPMMRYGSGTTRLRTKSSTTMRTTTKPQTMKMKWRKKRASLRSNRARSGPSRSEATKSNSWTHRVKSIRLIKSQRLSCNKLKLFRSKKGKAQSLNAIKPIQSITSGRIQSKMKRQKL